MTKEITKTFAALDEKGLLERVQQAADGGTDPMEILKACQEAMMTVGEKFEQGVYFISDLMLAGQMFKQVNEILKPKFGSAGSGEKKGKVVIGTVDGDIHDIGKDLVVALLEANSFEVYDLGVDQKTDVFIEKLKETGATVVGMSGLLTIAFDAMKDTVEALKAEGMRDKVKVMIGGGSINQGTCDFIGADAWGINAQSAVQFCRQWING